MLAHPYAVLVPGTTTGTLPTIAPASQTMDMCAHAAALYFQCATGRMQQ